MDKIFYRGVLDNPEKKWYTICVDNIDWDVEDEAEFDSLPQRVFFQVALISHEEIDDLEIANWLSEEFGHCVNAFGYNY